MARPRDLHRDLAAAHTAGVDTVVSLLEPAEARDLGLAAEADTCAALGLRFHSHPVPDMLLPEPRAFRAFAQDLAEQLDRSAGIAVHCRASIGRSGMLACAVLGKRGYDGPSAISHVSAARGLPVPDTAEQAAFISSLADITG